MNASQKEWFTTSSGRIEFQLAIEDAHCGSHQGSCDADIAELVKVPYIFEQLAAINPDLLRCELAEYGAWDDTELSNHDENLKRILWIACGDIAETHPLTRPADMFVLFSDASGIYIPQRFAREMDRTRVSGLTDQWEILETGPGHDEYWDAWAEVLDNAVIKDKTGREYTLIQDGDCWAIEKNAQFDERTGKYYVEI